MQQVDTTTITVTHYNELPDGKAIAVSIHLRDRYIPKSKIINIEKEKYQYKITVPTWLAKKNYLIP